MAIIPSIPSQRRATAPNGSGNTGDGNIRGGNNGLLVTVPRLLPGTKPGTLVVGSLPFWKLTNGPKVIAANRGSFNEVSPWIYRILAGRIRCRAQLIP